MLREIDLSVISDNKLYKADDMVKMGCSECKGCSECCRGMGKSILLDPLDVFNMSKASGESFEKLLQEKIEISVVDGIMGPNIKMQTNGACAFLSEEGRCTIHTLRPGFCRLFPLGRVYHDEDDGFDYFLQVNECSYPNKTKVKIKKWMDLPSLREYDDFIVSWHKLIKEFRESLKPMYEISMDEEKAPEANEKIKEMNLYYLRIFFLTPYDMENSPYSQIYERIEIFKKYLRNQ